MGKGLMIQQPGRDSILLQAKTVCWLLVDRVTVQLRDEGSRVLERCMWKMIRNILPIYLTLSPNAKQRWKRGLSGFLILILYNESVSECPGLSTATTNPLIQPLIYSQRTQKQSMVLWSCGDSTSRPLCSAETKLLHSSRGRKSFYCPITSPKWNHLLLGDTR